MNRRDLFKKIIGCLAALGLTASVKAVEKEPKPIALVIECDFRPSPETRVAMRKEFAELIGKDCPPVIVLPKGTRIRTLPDAGLETRIEAYRQAFSDGIMTVDDIRRLENLPPLA